MKNLGLLPKLALSGIKRNASAYVPYLIPNTLCICVFNIFISIAQNEILSTLPYSEYLKILMLIGAVLLGIILAPFLTSIYKFLIKQRKTELGLYSILGLDKKNIAAVMLIEALLLYIISMAAGLLTATVFSKLVFLLLLNITQFPIETEYTTSVGCLLFTLAYFGAISAFNLISTLFKITLSNPSELFSSGKKGEREPKHLVLYTVFGLLSLGGGYFIALKSRMNSMVFIDFFLAVALVVVGTHYLFTSGSISFLRLCKRNKKLYYKSSLFVAISGMLYRMKKNASGLVNICIFSTMTIITVIFTCIVFIGQDDAVKFQYPFDAEYYFTVEQSESDFEKLAQTAAEKYDVTIEEVMPFNFKLIKSNYVNNVFSHFTDRMKVYDSIRLISVSSYNEMESKNVTLAEDEILFFTAAKDLGYDEVTFGDHAFKVKEELQSLRAFNKNDKNYGMSRMVAVFADDKIVDELYSEFALDDDVERQIYSLRMNFSGENAEKFVNELDTAAQELSGFSEANNVYTYRAEGKAIFGGLLFLGIFFGIIFMVCLILIMYYKQITEGYEDRRNFEIMQKVGMSDKEVKNTIFRQIITVFMLPLCTAVIHTLVASNIISNLVAALQIYSSRIVFMSIGVTTAAFALCYLVSYLFTARAYYKIVK